MEKLATPPYKFRKPQDKNPRQPLLTALTKRPNSYFNVGEPVDFFMSLGNESALPALREAQDDREFEVAMQIRQAIERIESGKVGQGPVWRQMTQGD